MTTNTQVDQFDAAKAEAFADQLVGAINGASVVALTSIGSRAGLFEAMAGGPAATSREIAEAAGLDERYVREWLGGMVVGKVIDYDASTQTYRLPPEHAAFLTEEAGPNNLSVLAQVFPYFGVVQEELVASFQNGGGVPYESYPDFQVMQARTTTAYLDASLVQAVLPLAPGVVDALQSGAEALDIGTGAGHAVNVMAAAFPNSRFTGYDFSADGIALGREESERMRLTNTRFEVRDIANLGATSQYDLITAIELVHDLARPLDVLRGVYDSLKPDGTFLVVDIAASSLLEENMDHPLGPTLYTFSVYHCMTVSLAQGGVGLGTVVGEQKVTELLHEAGFRHVEVKHIEGDIFYAYYIAKK